MMLTNELIDASNNNDLYKICFIQKCVQEKIYIISTYNKKFKYKFFKNSRFNKFINYYDNYLRGFLTKYNHIFNIQPKQTFDVFNTYCFEHCLLPEQLKKISLSGIEASNLELLTDNNPHSNMLILPKHYIRNKKRCSSYNPEHNKAKNDIIMP